MNYKKTGSAAVALSLAAVVLLTGCGGVIGASTDNDETENQETTISESETSTEDGTTTSEDETSTEDGTTETSLTDDEIAWFNEEFFNGDDYNFHNQLLSSLYDTPEEINLLLLFYRGNTTDVTEEELEAVAAAMGSSSIPDNPCHKNTVEEMNAVLEENMGITLEETNGVGLEEMTYLSEYDAYYNFHGDWLYLSNVTVTSGYRDGDGNIYLYYYSGQRVLCLKENGDGYLFVSNTDLSESTEEETESTSDDLTEEIISQFNLAVEAYS